MDEIKESLKISAVIPVYNCEQYITDVIKSLEKQTYPLYEIIVIDDNSTDATHCKVLKLAHESRCHIKAFRHRENKGVSEARNLGIRKAKGNWILFIDGDDTAEPRLLELQLKSLEACRKEKPNQWVLVHTAHRQITEEGKFFDGIHRFKQVEPEEILGYQFVRNHVCVSGTLVNKKEIQKLGGFDTSLTHSEDWDMWLQLAQVGGFVYVDQPLFNVRRHKENASKRIKDMLNGEQKVFKKYELSFIESSINKRSLSRTQNGTDYVSILFKIGFWEEGYEYLKKQEKTTDFAPLSFLLGLYYLHHQHINNAKALFNNTLKHNPCHGAALNNLGAISILLGQYDAAQTYLHRALSLFPNYIDAKHNHYILKTMKSANYNDLKFTWRELRKQLTSYEE
ncbi:glycosyltransferase [Metabacillus herbersteinensis]|uniref:Glycosyltransferase n=1 Tax=Metabacillus herbersteinensis TaxID=283816 RepID=A0ABV6GE19_9BACI